MGSWCVGCRWWGGGEELVGKWRVMMEKWWEGGW